MVYRVVAKGTSTEVQQPHASTVHTIHSRHSLYLPTSGHAAYRRIQIHEGTRTHHPAALPWIHTYLHGPRDGWAALAVAAVAIFL